MIEKITIPMSIYVRMRAFVNMIASTCASCFRRSKENCESCDDVNAARKLMSDIKVWEKSRNNGGIYDTSFYGNCQYIVDQLLKANHHLCSNEIIVRGACKQRKQWMLKRLCRNRTISSVVTANGRYEYFLSPSQAERIIKQRKEKKEREEMLWHSI